MKPDGTVQRRDWSKRLPMPSRHTRHRLERLYTPAEMDAIWRGFIPSDMRDKRFMYFEDGVLHMHRSWTGYCIYQAEFARQAVSYRMKCLKVNRQIDCVLLWL